MRGRATLGIQAIAGASVWCALIGLATAQVPAAPRQDFIVELPVSPWEVDQRGVVLDRLKGRLAKPDASAPGPGDLIVVLTSLTGEPILPDTAARQAPGWRPRHGRNELIFTFESPEVPWTPEDVALLSNALAAFYPVALRIYGEPAFDIAVNVRQDPTISMAGLYNVSTNEMTVKGASPGMLDVLCHEMLHAFRDEALIGLASFEEGMARAGEIEIFERLPEFVHPFDESHGYEYDVYYEALNRPAIGATGGNLLDGYAAFLLRYQLAGYAWGKALIEDDQFLVRFNRTYYRQLERDPATRYTETSLVELAAAAAKVIEGEPFGVWYARQHVLNTTPPAGLTLFQRVNQFTIDLFERSEDGSVTMISDALVDWRVVGHDGALLDAGTGLTAANGHVLFNPSLPDAYTGRLRIEAVATTGDGRTVQDVTLRPFISGPVGEGGVFGLVAEANEGTVVIQSLDRPRLRASVPLVNGVFSAPSLENSRGRFVALFYDNGVLRGSQVFTKDAARYFVGF